jgi:hypothetical protein
VTNAATGATTVTHPGNPTTGATTVKSVDTELIRGGGRMGGHRLSDVPVDVPNG